MDQLIRNFALQMLRKLQKRTPKLISPLQNSSSDQDHEMANGDVPSQQQNGDAKELSKTPSNESGAESAADENAEDGQLPSEDIIQTPYLPDQLELPADKVQVLQHVELLFALSVKVPEFLEQ